MACLSFLMNFSKMRKHLNGKFVVKKGISNSLNKKALNIEKIQKKSKPYRG